MSGPRAAAAVAGVELRRLARDKVALFFLLVLPFALILALGSAFSTDDAQVSVGVVVSDRSGLAGELLADLRAEDRLDVVDYDDERSLSRDVRLGQVSGGVVIPRGLGRDVEQGRPAAVRVLGEPTNQSAARVEGIVESVVQERALVVTATRFAGGRQGVDPASAAESARAQVDRVAGARVEVTSVGAGSGTTQGSFAFVAMAQVILFMFINSLAGGGSVVEMRTYGVASRAMAAPIGVGDLVAGVSVARYAIAVVQGLVIVLVAGLGFGVEWGDPAVVLTVIVVFGAVAAGGGVLTGALARTADQAAAIGVPLSLALAALGGCFFPLSIAPPAMQTIAKVTPHAWATEALSSAMFDGASLADVTGNVVVLAGFAVVLSVLGVVALRRRLARPWT